MDEQEEQLTPFEQGLQVIENPPLPDDLGPLMPRSTDTPAALFRRSVSRVLPEDEQEKEK